MSYDDMRRRLNGDLRLTYETYLLAVDKEEVRRKKDEELFRQARLRQNEAEKQIRQEKLDKENELFERAEKIIAKQYARVEADPLPLKYEIAELRLLCKNMREEIETLKAEVAELRAEKSCTLAHKFSS